LTIESSSGDWALYPEYYFRPDGTLAFMYSELHTFYGNVCAEDRFYYDPAGRELRRSKRLYDLSSGEPLKSANFQHQDAPVYKTAKDFIDELGRLDLFH